MEYILNYINGIDPSLKTLPSEVYFIWQTTLIVVVVVIVPLAIFLLQRTLRASLDIKRYFKDMLDAGVGIADNTSSITALNDTIEVATAMVGVSNKLDEHSATIASVLSDRASNGSTP